MRLNKQENPTRYQRKLKCIRCGITWTTPKKVTDTELEYLLSILNVCPAGCYTHKTLKHITMEVTK